MEPLVTRGPPLSLTRTSQRRSSPVTVFQIVRLVLIIVVGLVFFLYRVIIRAGFLNYFQSHVYSLTFQLLYNCRQHLSLPQQHHQL